MEAALATIIVGVGTLGMIQLLATGTVANTEANELTTAMTLANNIHEMLQQSASMYFSDPTTPTHWGLETGETIATADDIDDFDGYTFSPAVDARRQSISYLTNWTQTINVDAVDPNNFTSVKSHIGVDPTNRPCSRVTVTVKHNNLEVYKTSWIATYTP